MRALIRELETVDEALPQSSSLTLLRRTEDPIRAADLSWRCDPAASQFRPNLFGHTPVTIWLTGLSGAGKSTLARALEERLMKERRPCFVLDDDNIGDCLDRDLGPSGDDRKENIRHAAKAARSMNEAGLIVIATFISPYREDRETARAIIGDPHFVEVHVSASADVCELRDPKGLHAKTRSGQILAFTGISSPYEIPLLPTLVLDTGVLTVEHAVNELFELLAARFFG
ncbi:MAG TPA: adenylyl-sulfate kinase [Oxalobacteraceae bacterium]|jgi:adenylyl-sulfate kinase|nr:adenylyl-sulfate kinase [Oxalobacteraceae bacterium]